MMTVEAEQNFLDFIWKSKEPKIVQIILKKNKVQSSTLIAIKTYYEAIITKAEQ